MQKTLFLVSIALLLAFCLAGPLHAADSIKFGVIEPSSGKFKDIGDRYLAGAQAAADEINRNGGLLGPSFHKLGVQGLEARYGRT